MARTQITYLGIAAVFVLSLTLFLWLPSGEFIQQLAAVPLVGSLLGALFQLIRDQTAHDREMAVLEAQNRFSLGASSHMANVAFDKHVQFSEEYVAEVHKALRTLFREGPTPQVLEHTRALYLLQQKYAVWLTSKIEADLELFESALRRLGADAQYLKSVAGTKDTPQRTAAMYKTFVNVIGSKFMGASKWDGEELSEDLAVSMVIQRLRAILGTEELTEMRGAIVSKALSELRKGC